MNATLPHIQDALRRARDAHARLQQTRTIEQIITALGQAAQSWLIPDNPWRTRAIEQAPAATGFSPAMIEEAIRLTFGPITPSSLGELLDRELGDRRVLDEFRPHGKVQARASGPPVITHILAGNVPPPGIISICCGLMLKSGNVVKLSQRDPVFPSLFVESLRAVDSELAASVTLLEWPRSETALTQAAVNGAGAVIAYGDDSAVNAVRRLLPDGAAFLGYGQKMSFAYIGKEAMTAENLPSLAEAAAFDVSVYDQQGCLSPHVIYVEERGALGPRKFAAALAEAMGAFHARIPRGTLSVEEASQISLTRSGYEFRAASDRRVAVWASSNPNDWAVIYEDNPAFEPSCLNRVVFVKPTDGIPRVLDAIQRFASRISTVGLAPMSERMNSFTNDLARLGVNRVCPIGQMQRPPLWWYHDGKPNLASLLRWTELG